MSLPPPHFVFRKDERIAQMNIRAANFWKETAQKALTLLESPVIHEMVMRDLASEQALICAATPDERLCLLRKMPSVESVVLRYAPVQAVTRAQSIRAQRPRIKIGDSGRSLKEIIAELVNQREHRMAQPKELWPCLYATLDEDGCSPQESCSDSKAAHITYEFGGGRRRLTYSRFRAIVREIRRSAASPANVT